jgi:4-amino-4-deoxy-L-arabinose transferase-like glycosyltransferase
MPSIVHTKPWGRYGSTGCITGRILGGKPSSPTHEAEYLNQSLRDPFLAAILGAALILRLAAVPLIHQLGYVSDEREYVSLAERILDGSGFVDSNGTQSVRAPLFPALLAATIYLDGGDRVLGHLLGALLGVAAVWLVYGLGREIFADRRIALYGALIAALYPGSVTYSAMLETETLYIVFFLAVLLISVRLVNSPRVALAAGLGVSGGLAALTRAVFVPFFPLLLLVLWFVRIKEGWHWFRQILVAGVLFLIVLLPWGVRNFQIHHRVVPVSTFAGQSLLLGNNPFSSGTTRLADGFDGWLADRIENRMGRPPEELTEIERADVSWDIAMDYILNHPRRFAELLVRKAHVLLIYPITNSDSYIPAQMIGVLSDLVLLLAAAAGWVLSSRKRAWVRGILAICVFFAVVHIVLHAEARYRLPLTPLLCMLAGVGIVGFTTASGRALLWKRRRSANRLALMWVAIIAVYVITGLMFISGEIS